MNYSYLDSAILEEDIALLQLSLCDGIGPRLSYQLLDHFGSATELFKSVKHQNGPRPNSFIGLSPVKLLQLQQAARFTEALDLLKIHNKLSIGMVTINQPHYPQRIKEQNGAPLVLFHSGLPSWNTEKAISVVGTRKPTQRGLSITQEILTELHQTMTNPWITVSGLAIGIDAQAHRTSVELSIPTYAIVAHGLEQIYPRNHQRLANEIIQHGGAIISEHPAYTKMHPNLFPRRNRLIAAMSDALLIIESGTTGGSMVTAGIACHLNKEVFAIPGHPKDSNSTGCNSLIQECMANLCTSADDIISKMNWIPTTINAQSRVEIKEISNKSYNLPLLSPQEKEILHLITQGNSRLQDLSTVLTTWKTSEILTVISQLQISGLLVRESSQHFKVIG
jgi:DNA processing protein